MNNTEQIDLKEAVKILKKCPRQITRDIKDRKLPAEGGGRGTPYSLNLADVIALKKRQLAICDANVLARIAYAYECKHSESMHQKDLLAQTIQAALKAQAGSTTNSLVHPDYKNFPNNWPRGWLNAGFLQLWRLRRSGNEAALSAYLQHSLPALSDVPEGLIKWANDLKRILTPEEMDYLAATFIARQYPIVRYKDGDGNSLDPAMSILKQNQPLYFTGWPEFKKFSESEMRAAWNIIEDQVWQNRPSDIPAREKKMFLDSQRKLFVESKSREKAWEIFFRYHPYDILDHTLLDAYRLNNQEAIQNITHQYDNKNFENHGKLGLFPLPQENATLLCLTASRQQKRLAQKGCSKFSAAKVGEVLGIDRFRASRLWVGEKGRLGIRKKIGPEGIVQLAKMLLLEPEELPKTWKTKHGRKSRARCNLPMDEGLTCPKCRISVSENAAFCPECKGHLLSQFQN